jgi:pyroglutamyl-peptidase
MTKTCLITGFDSFGRNRFNPSEALVRMLPETTKSKSGELMLSGTVLPTCCDGAWTKLRPILSKSPPDVLILTGLAQNRHRISLERFALNIRDYRIPDNEGHTYDGELIVRGGPDALKTDVSLESLKAAVIKKGLPCEISNHAGSYVCNETYYRALKHRLKHSHMLVLFVHVPLPSWYGKTLAKESKKAPKDVAKNRNAQMQSMLKGVLTIAQFCADAH